MYARTAVGHLGNSYQEADDSCDIVKKKSKKKYTHKHLWGYMEFIHQTSHDGNADCLEPASLFKKEKKKKNHICFSPNTTHGSEPSRQVNHCEYKRQRQSVGAGNIWLHWLHLCILSPSTLSFWSVLSYSFSRLHLLWCISFTGRYTFSFHTCLLLTSFYHQAYSTFLLLIHLPGTTGVITFSTGFLLFEIYLESVIFCIVLNLDKYTW